MNSIIIALSSGLFAALLFGMAALAQRQASMGGADSIQGAGVSMASQAGVGVILLAFAPTLSVTSYSLFLAACAGLCVLLGTIIILHALKLGVLSVVAPFAAMSGVILAMAGLVLEGVPSLGLSVGLALAVTAVIVALRPNVNTSRKAVTLGLMAACLFAVADYLGLIIANHAGSPFTGAGMVICASALIGIPFLLARRNVKFIHTRKLVLAGMFGATAVFFLIVAIRASITVGALAAAQHSIIAMILGAVLLKERLSNTQKLAAFLAIMSTLLIAMF